MRDHFADAASARRRAVLRETVAAFERSDRYHACAAENLARWRAGRAGVASPAIVVLPGDWGEVTRTLTRAHGECFAVLNMANAYKPGGAYVEGAIAQEENMFRRTDCHFRIGDHEYDEARDRYRRATTRLLSA
ncbi:MAG: poly(ADP-ribose) glycohydrolase domain-containing protein, partial [Candidatus Solibacter sp.]